MDERRRGPRRARRRWSDVERDLRRAGGPLIAGVDEVGRGPLAGPVVACAIVMPPDARAIPGVNDSKVLTAAERDRLALKIRDRALAIALGAASVAEIDRLNIYHASALAMRRAIRRLPLAPDHVLIDGRAIRTLAIPHTAIVDGDARCFSIACASIIAKVTRDRLMRQLGARYPAYRWHRNAGYATVDHLAGLETAGLTPHHRRSFLRARQLSLALDAPEAAIGVADAPSPLPPPSRQDTPPAPEERMPLEPRAFDSDDRDAVPFDPALDADGAAMPNADLTEFLSTESRPERADG